MISLLFSLVLLTGLSGCSYTANKLNAAKTLITTSEKELKPKEALQALNAIKPDSKSPLDNDYNFTDQKPVRAGHYLYLWRQSHVNSLELWRSNGHEGGTRRLLGLPLGEEALKNLRPQIPRLLVVGSRVIFFQTVFDLSAKEAKADLYVSDGSVSGTKRIHTFTANDLGSNSHLWQIFMESLPHAQKYWVMDHWVYFVVHKTLWRSHVMTHETEAFYDLSPYMSHILTGLGLDLVHNKGEKLYFRAMKKNPLTQHPYALWELNTQNKRIRPIFSTQHDLLMPTIVSVFDYNQQIGASVAKPYVVATQEYWLLDIQSMSPDQLPKATLLLNKQQTDTENFDYHKPRQIGTLLYTIGNLPNSYRRTLWQFDTRAHSGKPVMIEGKYYLIIEGTGTGEDLLLNSDGKWTVLARSVPTHIIDKRLDTRDAVEAYPVKSWFIDAKTQVIAPIP